MRRAVLGLALTVAASATQDKKLNVVFIMSDDMRPELAGPYGQHVVTPNFERLANESTTFLRAYTQVAVCAPARTALLTGIYNDYARVWTIGPYFRKSMPPGLASPTALATLPQWFKENSYNTTGFGKIFHQGGPSGGTGGLGGGDAPFSWSESYWFCDQYWTQLVQSPASAGWPYGPGPTGTGTGCVQTPECVECLRRPLGSPGRFANGSLMGLGSVVSWSEANCPDSCYPDGLVGDAVVAQLEAKASPPYAGLPFFLAAGFKRPHLGFFAPKWAFDLYPEGTIQLAAHRAPPSDMPAPAWSNGGSMRTFNDTRSLLVERPIPTCPDGRFENFSGVFLPDSKHLELRRGYYAAVSLVDKQVGRILDALDATGLRGSTVVTFTGDHGFQLGEHGEWGKFTNFELGTRVPLMISLPPGMHPHPGSVSMAPVMHLDVFPTLVAITRLPNPPQNLSGLSLVPLLENPALPTLPLRSFAFSQYPRSVRGKSFMGMTMRTPRWRFTEWCVFDYGAAFPVWNLSDHRLCELELYDHANDTGSGTSAVDAFDNANLAYAPEFDATVRELHARIVANWDGGKQPPRGPPGPPPRPGPSPAPPRPPAGMPGFLVRTDTATGRKACLTAGPGGTCAVANCSPLWLGECSSASSVWQQTADGVELKSNATAGQCLNLYGGARSGTCVDGTPVHVETCGWARKGDRFALGEDGRLRLEVSAGGPCDGLCLAAGGGGGGGACPVVAPCTDASSGGWDIEPAGGSWE